MGSVQRFSTIALMVLFVAGALFAGGCTTKETANNASKAKEPEITKPAEVQDGYCQLLAALRDHVTAARHLPGRDRVERMKPDGELLETYLSSEQFQDTLNDTETAVTELLENLVKAAPTPDLVATHSAHLSQTQATFWLIRNRALPAGERAPALVVALPPEGTAFLKNDGFLTHAQERCSENFGSLSAMEEKVADYLETITKAAGSKRPV